MTVLTLPYERQMGDGLVGCESGQAVEVRGTVLRFTPLYWVMEIYAPTEALNHFQIVFQGRVISLGRALVTNLLNAAGVLACEVKLRDGWQEVGAFLRKVERSLLHEGLDEIQGSWHRAYHILPESKEVISDLQMTNLRFRLNRIEFEVCSAPTGDRSELGHDRAINQTFFFPTLAFDVYDVPVLPPHYHGLATTPDAVPGVPAHWQPVPQAYAQWAAYSEPRLGQAGDREEPRMSLMGTFSSGQFFAGNEACFEYDANSVGKSMFGIEELFDYRSVISWQKFGYSGNRYL